MVDVNVVFISQGLTCRHIITPTKSWYKQYFVDSTKGRMLPSTYKYITTNEAMEMAAKLFSKAEQLFAYDQQSAGKTSHEFFKLTMKPHVLIEVDTPQRFSAQMAKVVNNTSIVVVLPHKVFLQILPELPYDADIQSSLSVYSTSFKQDKKAGTFVRLSGRDVDHMFQGGGDDIYETNDDMERVNEKTRLDVRETHFV